MSINIYEQGIAERISESYTFNQFLETHIDLDSYGQLLELPWNTYQQILSEQIVICINDFKNSKSVDETKSIPNDGLKGIYFCVGDGGTDLSIAGSLYYDEEDWAANAEFYPPLSDELLSTLTNEVVKKLKIFKRFDIKSDAVSDFIGDTVCCFIAHTVIHTLSRVENINEIANSGISFGHSGGDELVLGNFSEGRFIQAIKVIGYTEPRKKSTAPVMEYNIIPTGDVWLYLKRYCGEFIASEGLTDMLDSGGEEAAKIIAARLAGRIFLNRCKACGHLKKTPRARQCLNCGEFIDP